MKLIIRSDSVEIDGYVNAIERKSKKLHSRMGDFVERIGKGAFKRAIERNSNIRLLLNHDRARDLGGTSDGNLELVEDAIGLHARATITDAEVVEKARRGDLVGWSFGFRDVPDGVTRSVEGGIPVRDVTDLDLQEVSILDRRRTPAYDGTLVSVRSEEDEVTYYGESLIDDIEVRAEETGAEQAEAEPDKPIDYSKWEAMITQMREEKR